MKNKIAIIIAMCLILSLVACVSRPTILSAENTEAIEATVTVTKPTSTTEPDKLEAVRGRVSEDAYVNEMLDLKIVKPEGWVFYTDEQIAQVNNLTYEAMQDSDIAEQISKNGQFMDMMMSDVNGNSVNLVLQARQPLLSLYTDEQAFAMNEESMKTLLASSGMIVTTYETVNMQIGGEERSVLHMVLETSQQINEYQIWYRNDERYMGILTVTTIGETEPQSILDGVTRIN